MAAPDVLKALRVPGRIAVAPTDLTTAWPHGGTGLGLVQAVTLKRAQAHVPIRAEDFGPVEVIDELYLGEAYELAFLLRGWDGDGWGQVFPNTFTGSTGGLVGLRYPGSVYPGELRGGAAAKVLFTPDDPLRHPAVYFPQAIAVAGETEELYLHRKKELVLKAAFVATRDAATAGRLAQVQLLEDLTL